MCGFLLLIAAFALAATATARAGDDPLAPGLERFESTTGWSMHGFVELRLGMRLHDDPHQDDLTVGDLPRLQLELSRYWGPTTLQLRADFLNDEVTNQRDLDLERGRGWLDLREANVAFSPFDFMDVKVGRQILTWGTGNLIFINDLFPKDWQSFFAGRDTEYLKAPSDAVFVSLFHDLGTLDIAITPRFDADRFITGERNSFWNGALGRRSGHDAIVDADIPNRWGSDAEIALRLSRMLGAWEVAGYGYRGFWKSPAGADSQTGQATFPELAVYGASLRGPALDGIVNAEIGYYDSLDDRGGSDPYVANSELRALLGYSRELAQDLSIGLQYYVEARLHHDSLAASLPDAAETPDEYRQVATLSLTKLTMNQNLILNSFLYVSPTDQDLYWRPSATWKANDFWQFSVGANVFAGQQTHTFFGQFEPSTNVYIAARRSF